MRAQFGLVDVVEAVTTWAPAAKARVAAPAASFDDSALLQYTIELAEGLV